MKALEAIYGSPLFGVGTTLIAYGLALALRKRWKWLHPLLVTTVALIVLLVAADIPYADYKIGGDIVTFFLGPATVALAVPLYKAFGKLKGRIMPVAVGVTVGSLTGLLAVTLTYGLLGASREVWLSLLPKSVTAPVAIEVAKQLGGLPELAGLFAVLTGLTGSVLGPLLLRAARIRGDLAIGTAMGTSSHGIGTARMIAESDDQGGISGLAMGLACMITPILCIPLIWWH